jgi:hypothetical protein
MDRNIRTVDDVLRLLDGLFAPEADRWTANADSCWWDSFYAEHRAREAGVEIHFHCGDAFTLTATALRGPYDLIYDSGCFHHLPPHRRISYLTLLDQSLAPGGHLAFTCFAVGDMGSELPDAEFYRHSRLDGGLAYTPQSCAGSSPT